MEEFLAVFVAKFLVVWVILNWLTDEVFEKILLAYLSITGAAFSAVCLNKLPINRDYDKFEIYALS